MDFRKRVGLRVKAIRHELGLTQDEFADKIDRSIETISNIERGISYPGFETLERLWKNLGIHPKVFFEFGDDDNNISQKRAQLIEDQRAVTKKLSDDKLTIAVKQLKALL
ncbi:MAG: helix-turn-helix transcriptional regulator [Hyphomonadaceae bacterium]|nr:helix-turn-helix transcriptional regulator [Hyphomonadaceae bacterium]